MVTRDRVAGLALLLLALLWAWETRQLPLGTLRDPGPGYPNFRNSALIGVIFCGCLIVSC
jgi:hypothetical protein